MNTCHIDICIYVSLETLETHDIYDMGTLNGTDWLSESVRDTPGTRDATHLKTTM